MPCNKGSLKEAEEGVKMLIWIDHDYRKLPINLACPEVDDEGNAIFLNADNKGKDDEGILNGDGEVGKDCVPPQLIIEYNPQLPATVTPPKIT